MMLLGERLDVRFGGRRHGDDLRLRDAPECLNVKLGDELRTDDAYAHFTHCKHLSRDAHVCGFPGFTSRLCFSASFTRSATIAGKSAATLNLSDGSSSRLKSSGGSCSRRLLPPNS